MRPVRSAPARRITKGGYALIFSASCGLTLLVLIVGYGLFFKDWTPTNAPKAPVLEDHSLDDEAGTLPWMTDPNPTDPAEIPVEMNVPEDGPQDGSQTASPDSAEEASDPDAANDTVVPEGITPVFPDGEGAPANQEFTPETTDPDFTPNNTPPTPQNTSRPNTAPEPVFEDQPKQQGTLPPKYRPTANDATLYYVVMNGFGSPQSAQDQLIRLQTHALPSPGVVRYIHGQVVLQFGVFGDRTNAEQLAMQLRRKGVQVSIEKLG